jgi:hypothetical protein
MKVIGAWAEIEYIPEGDRISAYFSFGEYDEEKECDSFGIDDNKIFYYCDMDELEMTQLMKSQSDFKVLSYELEYKNE